jgi:hypothetical protein
MSSPSGNIKVCYVALGYRPGDRLFGHFQKSLDNHWADFLQRNKGTPVLQDGKLPLNSTTGERIQELTSSFIEQHAQEFWPEEDSPCEGKVVWPRDEVR